MFIKEKYEKRLAKERQEEVDFGQLPNKIQIHKIGSFKNQKGKLNYDRDEQFFSQDDVPSQAKDAKKYIQQYIDPDLLGLRKKEWNNSCSVPKNPILEETHERKLIKIKLGLFDQPIPKQKDNVIYEGTETRNDYTNWNVSTEVNRPKMNQDLFEQTNKAKFHAKEFETMNLTNYNDPVQQQTIINEKFRQKKMEEQPQRKKLRDEFMHFNPSASIQKVDAAVFRLNYEQILRQQQIKQDMNATFKPNLERTLPPSFITKQKYYHYGHYKLNKEEKEDDENKYETKQENKLENKQDNKLAQTDKKQTQSKLEKLAKCRYCQNKDFKDLQNIQSDHYQEHKLLKLEKEYVAFKTCSYCNKDQKEKQNEQDEHKHKGQWTCCQNEDENAPGCTLFQYEDKNPQAINKNTIKLQKLYKYSHPGIFKSFKFDKPDKSGVVEFEAWSCCQSRDKNSKGCNKELLDKGKWNLASFVQSQAPADYVELKKLKDSSIKQ